VDGITVLLSTWNGARYLEVQLQSLRDQAGPPSTVLARDDGSTDGTRSILDAWAERHRGWLEVMPDDGVRRGASGSYGALLSACPTPYAMMCDQDDRWDPDKISRSWTLMQELERRHGGEVPLLVHGDARLMDEQARPLAGHLAAMMHHKLEDASRPERQVLHNHVTGCTLMLNRALIDLADPIPEVAVWHDWWIGLLACVCGKIACIPGTVLDYRQHPANVLGAGTMRWSALLERFPSPAAVRQRMNRVSRQAAAALARCQGRLGDRERAVLGTCADLPSQGWLARRVALMSQGMWMPGVLRNVALMVFG
jgi:glycosyltransferase involved in cell wall biosynthesis